MIVQIARFPPSPVICQFFKNSNTRGSARRRGRGRGGEGTGGEGRGGEGRGKGNGYF